ncbi:MAG: SGNH/GDSL hydrolase family protein [Vicinamibacterales bacterium]
MATSFLAFGDSLTEGVLSQEGTFHLFEDLPSSYPTQLRAILVRRYPAQVPAVVNDGRRGEWATDGAARFTRSLAQHPAQAVLLLEGVNDLTARGRAGIPDTVTAIDSMLRDGRATGTRVLLATMFSTRPGSINGGDSAPLIADYNSRLRELATQRGAVIVDLESAFGRDYSLLGPDGLHPNSAGYERMAVTFFNVIQRTFEVP